MCLIFTFQEEKDGSGELENQFTMTRERKTLAQNVESWLTFNVFRQDSDQASDMDSGFDLASRATSDDVMGLHGYVYYGIDNSCTPELITVISQIKYMK